MINNEKINKYWDKFHKLDKAAGEAKEDAVRIQTEEINTSTPAGFEVKWVTSMYYGSHDEYGEGDRDIVLAIQKGKKSPEFEFRHGHFSENHDEEFQEVHEQVGSFFVLTVDNQGNFAWSKWEPGVEPAMI